MLQETLSVYVVDDDLSIRKALERLLRSAGYHAMTFESAEEFLDSTSGRVKGCIVLDIRLPGITGLDLHEKLLSQGKKFQVIYMTAHDNPHWQERAKRAGALAYLRKPFGDQALLDAIRRFFGKGFSNNPENNHTEGPGREAGNTGIETLMTEA